MNFIQPNLDAIPAELCALPRWVTWRAIEVNPGEKPRKVPFSPVRSDVRASSTDPDTWGSFEQAQTDYMLNDRTGLGIVLNNDGLVGVDIDACVTDGKPDPAALALLEDLGAAYIEISPSGTGLRALGYGEPLSAGVNGIRDGLKAEFYSTGRYLTLTGKTIKAGPLAPFKDFAATAESFRKVKKSKISKTAGHLENVPPDERHAAMVQAILTGEVYHDSLRDLAASLVGSGMQPGAVVNHLRGLMDASAAPHDERWKARRAQILDLVASAVQKFSPSADDFEVIDPDTGEVVKAHPLAQFIAFDGTVRTPRWVIPGLVAHGVTTIAGAPGVGKTTAILPLSMVAAGLHAEGDPLAPKHWRHVIYITEDSEQAERILIGYVNHGGLGLSMDDVRKRLHLVNAVRLDPKFVASVGKVYREKFTRIVDGVEVLPLVVIDTKSAVLDLEDENDNAKVSAMIAALKQGFDGLPVWLIGHIAKADLNRSNVRELSNRGAGSLDGDGNQTMFLITEGEARFLVLGKVRFEPKWSELEVVGHVAQVLSTDEFGDPEMVMLRWGIAQPPLLTRREASAQARELVRAEEDATLRREILDLVQTAWTFGNPLNRTGVKDSIPRNKQAVGAAIQRLLTEHWLLEVEIPAKDRANNRRSKFLISLTEDEREVVLRGQGVPAVKLAIPESWRKTPNSVCSEIRTSDECVNHAVQ